MSGNSCCRKLQLTPDCFLHQEVRVCLTPNEEFLKEKIMFFFMLPFLHGHALLIDYSFTFVLYL